MVTVRSRSLLNALPVVLPGASVVTVPAGHYLQEEAPVPIADAIREVARRARIS